MFFELLSKYNIGGKFLTILKDIYFENKVHIKLPLGLTEHFVTKVGVKQGCVLSPQIFNLFLNKIPDLFDSECDPVYVNDRPLNVIMWADDLFLVSKSVSGLTKCIDRTSQHCHQMGLSVNTTKTQIMILNNRGLKLDSAAHSFYIDGKRLKVVGEYKYLGFILKPSGTITAGVNTLHDKASRA